MNGEEITERELTRRQSSGAGSGILPRVGLAGRNRIQTDRHWLLQYTEKVHTPVFLPCHRNRSKIGTEVKLGVTVASMFWGEHQAIETTTSISILVLNYVVYT